MKVERQKQNLIIENEAVFLYIPVGRLTFTPGTLAIHCTAGTFSTWLSFFCNLVLFVFSKSNSVSGLSIAVIQSLSCVRFFTIPWTAARQASPSFTISWSV